MDKLGTWADEPCFYVDAIDGDRMALLAGPFKTLPEGRAMKRATIIDEQFKNMLDSHAHEQRCGFCYPSEHGRNGEVKREWSSHWGMFINFCRKHSPEANKGQT